MLLAFLLLPSVLVSVALGNFCPHDPTGMTWFYAPDAICLSYQDTAGDTDTAFVECSTSFEEGMIAMTDSAEKASFIQEKLSDFGVTENIWNGVVDIFMDDVWDFSDRSLVTSYHPWAVEPVSGDPKNCAVQRPDTLWVVAHCDNEEHTYLCQYPATFPTCGYRWHLNPEMDACIKPIKNRRKTYNGARQYCQKLGGDLATKMTDKTQIKHVNSFINFRGHFWIGVEDILKDGAFTDFNGNELDKSRFKKPGPYPGRHCVSLKRGKWFPKVCTRRFFFICQKDP